MKLIPQSPKKALKAFLKQKPLRSEIDIFKANLIALLDKISVIEKQPKDESEEHLKNNLRDFLRDTYYKDTNAINTKDKKDLVIHVGKSTGSEAGVIIEAKRPTNINEMVTADRPNQKGLHELILYYLDERHQAGNNQLKQLIITNVYEWFIIDANYFDHHIYRNPQIKKLYETKINDKKDNPFFYEEIAKILSNINIDIPCVYFDIREFEAILRNNKKADDKELIALFKIFSPQHLLKIESANDSNSLNERFYKELLYIIGLEETKENGKNIIRRKKDNRNDAALLELTIDALVTDDILHRIPDVSIYGETKEEIIYNIALELCITWINRILFLKLLEGQLMTYHQSPSPGEEGRKGEVDYKFLNSETIHDFDELFNLFHRVLAVGIKDRKEDNKKKYSKVPYLNSSLFEISELEDYTIKINSLTNSGQLKLINTTILKEIKKKADRLPSLEYLFKFLDAYDFASEGSEDVQEDNKTIINASVLGKVFEKINGYKDGSIFTPAFITMYMCRESIRLAVVEKFNEALSEKGKKLFDKFEDVIGYTSKIYKTQEILKANEIINSLRICDPAVGSGHFLVSALNEIIAIKSELGILADEKGSLLKDVIVEVVNDELYIYDRQTFQPFKYTIASLQNKVLTYGFGGDKISYQRISNSIYQRVQKTLFQEKQIIIENCLFGVDINPKSVLICRLRLWIELLKNAYYKEPDFTELETLPNIDINIKIGNSLISRFALDADLSKALKSIKYDIKAYRGFVNDYKKEKNRDVKRALQKIIYSIKSDFRTTISQSNPKKKRLDKLLAELYHRFTGNTLFEDEVPYGNEKKKSAKNEKEKLDEEIEILSKELDEIKSNAIYKNAFEWRFEFPEVLNDNGEFEGFDVVIGNPPYFSIAKNQSLRALESSYQTFDNTGDIYCLFYEKGYQLLKNKGALYFITSNKWLRANYGQKLREFFINKTNPIFLFDFSWFQVFDNASVDSNILGLQKTTPTNQVLAAVAEKDFEISNLEQYIEKKAVCTSFPASNYWTVNDNTYSNLKSKIASKGKILSKWDFEIYRGVLTGLNEAFIINEVTKNKLVELDKKNSEILKPLMRGRDVERYGYNFENLYLINSHNGTKELKIPAVNLPIEYPAIYEYLLPFKPMAEVRADKGDNWYNLRNCAYLNEFEKEKLIWAETMRVHKTGNRNFPRFGYDNKGSFTDKTVFIGIGSNLKYLLAFLNSSIGRWLIMEYVTKLDTGGYMMQKTFLDKIPIYFPIIEQEEKIIDLVDKILQAKQAGKDSNDFEKQVDQLVYKLYDITDDEQKLIEGTATTQNISI